MSRNLEADFEDLRHLVITQVKTSNTEQRRFWKKVMKLEKRIEYVLRDMWEQELFLVKEDVNLADRIDLLVKVTRINQDILEDLVGIKAKGGEKE